MARQSVHSRNELVHCALNDRQQLAHFGIGQGGLILKKVCSTLGILFFVQTEVLAYQSAQKCVLCVEFS